MNNFIPIVREKEASYDVYSRLLEDRIILLTGSIDEKTSEVIVAQLLYLNAKDPSKPINLYINSPGGMVVDGFAIYDTMKNIHSPVYTTVFGHAASMAAILLSGGEKGHRVSLPNSDIMIHQVLGGASGQYADVKIKAEHMSKINDKLVAILAENCGKSISVIKNDVDRDFHMNPLEAVKYGIIDKVMNKIDHKGVKTSSKNKNSNTKVKK